MSSFIPAGLCVFFKMTVEYLRSSSGLQGNVFAAIQLPCFSTLNSAEPGFSHPNAMPSKNSYRVTRATQIYEFELIEEESQYGENFRNIHFKVHRKIDDRQ